MNKLQILSNFCLAFVSFGDILMYRTWKMLWIVGLMKVIMLLYDVATISSGYLFRSKLIHQEGGEYRVIQMRDIDEYNRLDMSGLERVDIRSLKGSYLVYQGDILFMSRGQHNWATFIDEPLEKTIAVSQFFVIRVKDKSVLPAYLAWYINQKPAQKELARKAAGTRIQLINKENLGQIEVVAPELEVQKKIVELGKLSIEEQLLMDKLKDKRTKYLQSALLKKISDK